MAGLDHPAPVRPGEELDVGRLREYLRQHLQEADGEVHGELRIDEVPGDSGAGELTVEQFPRGFSNLTYLLRLDDRELVLRRPPFGTEVKSAHDMGREHRILAALRPVYARVPRPLLYCDDPAVLGAPFYVMERVRGVILRPHLRPQDAPSPQRMAAIAEVFAATLADLHAVDYEAAGLGDLGRPEGYVERQVEGWARRYQRARTDEVAAMERVAAWLAASLPPESGAALIHNDFKYDNLVLDLTGEPTVVAVLDWEMATVGDPRMDLGTTLGYWLDADDPPLLQAMQLSPTTLPGNPGRAEIAEMYARRSGRELGDLLFYYVFGLFKIAVIAQQIYYRYRQGHTRDPRFAQLGAAVRALAQAGVQAIDRRRIDRLFG